MITHTDGRIIIVNYFEIKGTISDNPSEGNGIVQATMFKDLAHKLRWETNTLDVDFEHVKLRNFDIPDIVDKLNTTIDGGQGLWDLVYQFILDKLGDGWQIN